MCQVYTFAQNADRIKVGIFWDGRPQRMLVSGRTWGYDIYADGVKVDELSPAGVIQLSAVGTNIQLRTLSHTIGTYHQIELRPQNENSSLILRPSKPALPERKYEGKFIITVSGGLLKIINDVKFDLYLAGVVQSEAGNYHTLEYYKVQAIICRTYALKHFFKYKADGFNLCDRVDSQVYKTLAWNDTIRQAVAETKDVVIVDSDINLISAVFHSNSGGATINSEDLWVMPVPYLRAVTDSFSICEPHYDWSVAVEKNEFLSYFAKNGVDTTDSTNLNLILNYCPNGRYTHFFPEENKVPLRQFRSDFKLNSTYFCTGVSGDSVIVVGKGFGHGVGLSQEGAMHMARLGYTYTEILHHYYQNIHLIKLSVIDFFREEN